MLFTVELRRNEKWNIGEIKEMIVRKKWDNVRTLDFFFKYNFCRTCMSVASYTY